MCARVCVLECPRVCEIVKELGERERDRESSDHFSCNDGSATLLLSHYLRQMFVKYFRPKI